MRFSSRARAVAESRTLRLSAEVARLRAEGADVVSLLEGDPDLPTPEAVTRATQDALAAGKTRYSPSAGLPELRAAIARALGERNGITVSPEEVLVTNGAKQALYDVLQVLCQEGDEVVIPRPYWVTFPEAVTLAGARPVFAETHGGRLDFDAINRALTPRTRAIILNTPNNPTGVVYPEETLRAIVALAAERDILIVSDEAYEGLTYDGRRHVSVASLPRAAERTVTLQTFSKGFAMTGFRVGYLTGPAEIVRAAARVHGHVTGNVCTFAQHGALAALALGEPHRAAWREAHQKRRDVAFELGSRLFDCAKPEGGLFLWADVRRLLGARFRDSEALAEHLLHDARVATVPGSACGLEGCLRLSFSSPESVLREGFARIEKAL